MSSKSSKVLQVIETHAFMEPGNVGEILFRSAKNLNLFQFLFLPAIYLLKLGFQVLGPSLSNRDSPDPFRPGDEIAKLVCIQQPTSLFF
jgi:hypothetical protein